MDHFLKCGNLVYIDEYFMSSQHSNKLFWLLFTVSTKSSRISPDK